MESTPLQPISRREDTNSPGRAKTITQSGESMLGLIIVHANGQRL